MKGFTSILGLGRDDLDGLIDSALEYTHPARHDEVLRGRTVAMLFFERSTRTRLSFQLAANKLGAHVLNLDPSRSSTGKGESLRDTVLTVSAMGAEVLVVRHAESGVPEQVHEWTGAPVINAGDGTREHPTQALVDMVTLRRHFGEIDGLRMAIVGDIAHSRVAGSLIRGMPTVGVHLTLVGPQEFLPTYGHDIETTTDLDELLPDIDVVYLLRVQTERGASVDASFGARYGLDSTRAALMPETSVIMHPGPLNRGVEISDDVADGPRSLILDQVANGVPTRMAVLAALEGALV